MEALITLQNIAFRRAGREILSDINLQIEANKIITIVGPNGAGKSTLISLMLNLIKPSSGKITQQKNLKISFVPQKFPIPPDLPLNVESFLQEFPNSEKEEYLKRFHLENLKKQLLKNLSGGELQRLLLVRAILRQPELIILDEPAAGIDPLALNQYYKNLREYQQQKKVAIVMVSHDLHLVMAASDYVICLNRHICCHGTPQDIVHYPDFVKLLGNECAIYTHQHNHEHW